MLPDYTKNIYHKSHAVQGNGSDGRVLDSPCVVDNNKESRRLCSFTEITDGATENGMATFLGTQGNNYHQHCFRNLYCYCQEL